MDGVILVDKPAGPTSHDVVAARPPRAAARRKVGHAGTLDPFATGLLLVLVGRATRVQRFLMALAKDLRDGRAAGVDVDDRRPRGRDHRDRARAAGRAVAADRLVRQRPPAYSAVRIDGQRAYELARARGETVEVPEREVTVYRFEQLLARRATAPAFVIECSSGTYVRSLIADLGDAYCVELRRTRDRPVRRRGRDAPPTATTPSRSSALSLATRCAASCRRSTLDATTARRAGHGQAVESPADAPDGEVLLVDADGARSRRRATRRRCSSPS